MLFSAQKDIPLDAGFNDKQFENIFLYNRYPGVKGKSDQASNVAEKAEIWALYDGAVHYNGLNMLRRLRSLWGIHLTLKIGPRSRQNPAPRGECRLGDQVVYFEGYAGNISDAVRDIVSYAPYGHGDKSRALSQKFFIRFIVPLKGKTPHERIDSLLMAYGVAGFLDAKSFAGIVDPDIFLFVPPQAVRAGLMHYHREDRLLNTHLLTGFNFYEKDDGARFFTHGLARFGLPDILLGGERLTPENYGAALRYAHELFLQQLSGNKPKFTPLKKRDALPGQVSAMMGRNVVVAALPA